MTVYINGAARPAVLSLHDVSDGAHWDDDGGTDFHMWPSLAQISGTGNREDLSDVGWTKANLAFVSGSGADFMTSVDPGIPEHFVCSPASALIQSPDIFGCFVHFRGAAHHLGYDPTTLTMEAWAQFVTALNDETATGFGFVVAGGSIITEADHVAVIRSDSSVFACRSNVDADAGAAIDTSWHLWKIICSLGTTDKIEWFIDGASQGTLDLREDMTPMSWGAGNVAGGNNRLNVGPVHIYYR